MDQTYEMSKDCKRASMTCPLSAFPNGFPCGVLHCTCEKYPRVLYANRWIYEILGVSANDEYWRDFLQDNIFFMIPAEQWSSFRSCLQQAEHSVQAVSLEHRIKNKQGRETEVMGWVRGVENEQGEKEYLFLYFCLPEEKHTQFRRKQEACLNLLARAYDGVFRIERQNHIVECLSIKERLNTRMYFMNGMRIVLDCMLQKSYYSLVYADDRRQVEEFFQTVVQQEGLNGCESMRIEFRTVGEGVLREFVLDASELDTQTVLLCCREVTEERSAKRRIEELNQVKSINAKMQERGERPNFQIAVFRVLNDTVFHQMGDTSYLTDNGMPLGAFLQEQHISWETYQKALNQGEAVLEHSENSQEEVRLYVTRKGENKEGNRENLLLLYRFRQQKDEKKMEKPRVSIRTFGFFDVFVDGKPIVFPHEKSKEMLALMVDRKGSFVGNPYFISCLWEDEPYGEKIQSRCRQTAFRMMETLKRYGIENIIEKVDGHRRIIPEMVSCDYFDYINGENDKKVVFNGTYMSDYSWGEETLSTLLRDAEYRKKRET